MWRRRVKKKPSGSLKKILFVILIPLVFILLLVLVFKVGLFTIKIVGIESNRLGCVNESQLKDSSALLGKNFFMLDQQKLSKNFKEKFFCIKDVSLSRIFPNKAQLKVIGRQPVAVLNTLKDRPASASSLIYNIATPTAKDILDSFVVDSEGMIFSKDVDGVNVPKVFIYNLDISLGKKLSSNLITNCLKILDKIKTRGITTLDSWVNEDFFIVTSQDSNLKIIFRLDDNIDIQLGSLQLILDKAKIDSSNIEFVDLRFDKPVVRFAPKK